MKRIHVKFTKKRILGIAAVLIMSSYFIWFINGMRGSGVITDVKKYEDGNKYYIYCGDIKLRCTQNEYNLVLGDKKYSVQYSYNKLLTGKGHLELIKVLGK